MSCTRTGDVNQDTTCAVRWNWYSGAIYGREPPPPPVAGRPAGGTDPVVSVQRALFTGRPGVSSGAVRGEARRTGRSPTRVPPVRRPPAAGLVRLRVSQSVTWRPGRGRRGRAGVCGLAAGRTAAHTTTIGGGCRTLVRGNRTAVLQKVATGGARYPAVAGAAT